MGRLTAARRFCTDTKTLASIALFLGLLAVGLMTAELGPSLNLLAEQANTTLDKVSFLYTGRSIGYFLGSLFSGYLFDIIDREGIILGTSVIVNGICNCIIPFSKNLFLIIALCVLQGLSAGALDAGGSVCILRLHGSKVDPWMQAMHFFFAAGTTISPFIVGIFIDKTGNLKTSYLVMGIATCITAVFMFFTPSFKSERDIIQLAKRHKIVRKRYEKRLAQRKAKEELEKIEQESSSETGGDDDSRELGVVISRDKQESSDDDTAISLDDRIVEEEENKGEESVKDPREMISSIKYKFILLFCGAFLAFYASVEATYGSYVASYSKLMKFESEVSASYLTSAFWGSFCVGRLLSIPIAIWVPPEAFLVGSLVLTVLSALPLVVVPGKITTWVVSVMFGFFIGPIWATLWNIMGKYLVVTGIAGTVLSASSCVGELSFTIEVGQLIVKVGPKVFSFQQVASSFVELLMCIFIVVFFRRLHAKRATIIQEEKEDETLKVNNETAGMEKERDSDKDAIEKHDENEVMLDEM